MCSHICFLFYMLHILWWGLSTNCSSNFHTDFKIGPLSIKHLNASPSNIIFCILKSQLNSTTIYVASASITVGLIIQSLDEHLVAKTFLSWSLIMPTLIFFLLFINHRILINFDHIIRDEHSFWYICGWGTVRIIFCLLFRFIKFHHYFLRTSNSHVMVQFVL
jgi:hypothetical protein